MCCQVFPNLPHNQLIISFSEVHRLGLFKSETYQFVCLLQLFTNYHWVYSTKEIWIPFPTHHSTALEGFARVQDKDPSAIFDLAIWGTQNKP